MTSPLVAVAVLLVGLGLPNQPVLARSDHSLANLEVTDLAASFLAEDETASVGYAARYTLTEDLAQANSTVSLPTAWIPPDSPELDGLASPASGEFVIFSSSPDGVYWAPQVRQVGGLYLSPQLTPGEGTPAVADLAQEGDRVDFGVNHYALDLTYQEQEPRPDGAAEWELATPQTMFLHARSRGAEGGVGFGSRIAYLHAKGGDLEGGAGLALPDIEVPLPPGTWEETLLNWQAGIIAPQGAQVSLTSTYDAARDTVVFHPSLSGTLPESATPEDEPRTNVIGIVAFVYARPDTAAVEVGTMSSLSVPLDGRGLLASGEVGERAAISVPIEAGQRSELSIGAAATSGQPHLFGRSTSASSDNPVEQEPVEPADAVLGEIEGTHETTTGGVRYDVDPSYRGVPAVTNATLAVSGETLFDGIATPVFGADRALREADLVDARVFPAAWVARFEFAGGWIPVASRVYYDDRPLPFTVATSTAYTVGATVDFVYRVGTDAFVHLETSIIEPQEFTGGKAIVDGVAEFLGPVGTGEDVPATPVLVSLRADTAGVSPGTRAATAPLTVEAAISAGLYQPVAMPAGVGRGSLWHLYLDFTGRGPARSVFAQDSLGELVLLNRAPSLPGPAAPSVPPPALNPGNGLDVLVTGGNAVLLQL